MTAKPPRWNKMVPAEPFRTWAREATCGRTLSECAAMAGLGVVTLRRAIWGQSPKLRLRTAAGIATLHVVLSRQAQAAGLPEHRGAVQGEPAEVGGDPGISGEAPGSSPTLGVRPEQ